MLILLALTLSGTCGNWPSPCKAKLRIRYLFNQPKKAREMGITVKNFVRENFLLTRQLREHLTLMFALQYGSADRIKLG